MQRSRRIIWRALARCWLYMTDEQKAYWSSHQDPARETIFGAFIGFNLARWTQGLWPAVEAPIDEMGLMDTCFAPNSVKNLPHFRTAMRVTSNTESWVLTLHRSTNILEGPTPNNCIDAKCIRDALVQWHLDKNLANGTYVCWASVPNSHGVDNDTRSSTLTIP